MILIFGCARRIFSLVVLVILLVVAWHYRANIIAAWHARGDLTAAWHQLLGKPVATSAGSPEEIERSAEAKLQALMSNRPPTRTALSQEEVQAIMRTRIAPSLPSWVDSARIQLEGDQVRLSARVPVDKIPQVKDLGEVAGLLPDTPEVAVKGQLIPLERGGVALAVNQVSAAHVPVPRRLLQPIVRSLKRPGDTTPPDALGLPLPRSISSAYVRNDSLILMSRGPAPARSAR